MLVVDDEEGVLRAIRDTLRAHEVVTVRSGRAALATLERDPRFDFVLCDLHMPDMTGMDLYGRIKGTNPALAQRFVFMTAGAFTERSRHFLARESRPVLDKPIDVDRLRALIAGTT